MSFSVEKILVEGLGSALVHGSITFVYDRDSLT